MIFLIFALRITVMSGKILSNPIKHERYNAPKNNQVGYNNTRLKSFKSKTLPRSAEATKYKYAVHTPQSRMKQSGTNKFLAAVESALKSVSPVVASLTIPDLQPLLDIITSGYASLTSQISAALAATLTIIQETINSFTIGTSSQVEDLVIQGNAAIKTYIINSFNAAMTKTREKVRTITATENASTIGIVSSSNYLLVTQINVRIEKAEAEVEATINSSNETVINDAAIILANANNDVLSQIVAFMADEKLTSAILPRLTYADPKIIADLIILDSNNIYKNLEKLLYDALEDINDLVNATSDNVLTSAPPIYESANEDIVGVINENVLLALDEIKSGIDNITADIISQMTGQIDIDVSELTDEIERLIHEINDEVETIVNEVTESQINQLTGLIVSNNNSVVSQVDNVLATAPLQ